MLPLGAGWRKDGLFGVAVAAAWLVVAVLEGFLVTVFRGGVFVLEGICAVLDWVGAEY